ncbi:restriction endonuclease subunit S [Methylomonas methanica]|uniref:Restriction modification system DNA specificity domain protein n=1 Tax=Methylomonas methanica (strain DSM 25384 / MC09) TaxID=857087 RepID=G0A1R5_METMM|nr:restriction endonuclease subunit S [Methylomonas methanica]AEG00126.1 restriction modification system DNA specificity domain protein [Methylomonas methanica MC09]
MNDLITQHLDLWTTAIASKSSAGRGNKSPSPKGEGRGEGNPTNTRNPKYTAYGIKKLRELILELAVRGKLVPQDPSDEPAKTLLDKIFLQKTRLINEGKLKPQKGLPEISEEEKPSHLPTGWELARLGEIINVINGRAYKKHEMLQEGTPLLRVGNLFTSNEWYYSDLELEPDKYIDNGDLIYAWSASFGPFIWQGGKAIYHYHIWKFDLFDPSCLDKQFLFYFFKSITEKIKASGNGIAMIHMTKERMEKLILEIPPLAEQHRIVAKVDELMALCDQLEQQQTDHLAAHQILVQTLLDTLTQAADAAEFEQAWSRIADHFDTLFTTESSIDQIKQTLLQLAVMGKLVPQNPFGESAKLFLENISKEKMQLIEQGIIRKQNAAAQIETSEKPQNIPVTWEISRLGDFTIVGTGSTPLRDKASYYFPPEINWVTSGETNQDYIFEANEKISRLALNETNVSVYPIGTLIIAMYGQGKTRGQVSELMIEAGTNQACAAVVCINKDVSHRRFIKLFFKKAYEELRSHSAGGAQPNLNLAKISNTVIPIPPLEEQYRIVAKVDELMALCDALKARIGNAQTTQLQLADAIVEQAVS